MLAWRPPETRWGLLPVHRPWQGAAGDTQPQGFPKARSLEAVTLACWQCNSCSLPFSHLGSVSKHHPHLPNVPHADPTALCPREPVPVHIQQAAAARAIG